MYNTVPAQVDHVTADYILGIVIVYLFKVAEFPFSIVIRDKIRYLNIELLTILIADKVDLFVIKLAYYDLIATAEHFKEYDIFI